MHGYGRSVIYYPKHKSIWENAASVTGTDYYPD